MIKAVYKIGLFRNNQNELTHKRKVKNSIRSYIREPEAICLKDDIITNYGRFNIVFIPEYVGEHISVNVLRFNIYKMITNEDDNQISEFDSKEGNMVTIWNNDNLLEEINSGRNRYNFRTKLSC